jgi:hypothetical protein
MELATVITAENWQDMARQAVEDLPTDIGGGVGWRQLSPDLLEVQVAREPHEEGTEASIYHIEVRWWDTLDEHLAAATAEEAESLRAGGAGMELASMPMIAARYPAEDPRRKLPLLTIYGESDWADQGLFATRAAYGHLRRTLHLAVLEELFSGGAVCKDALGRYVREDGSPVLPWQFRKKRPGKGS